MTVKNQQILPVNSPDDYGSVDAQTCTTFLFPISKFCSDNDSNSVLSNLILKSFLSTAPINARQQSSFRAFQGTGNRLGDQPVNAS
jgi:hypothetical protein